MNDANRVSIPQDDDSDRISDDLAQQGARTLSQELLTLVAGGDSIVLWG